jgi:hypothetical protein
MKTLVKNMENTRGNTAPNQFVIETDKFFIFQSYRSVIARKCKNTGKIELDSHYWDYSKTTGKFRNIFLRESKKETERKIKDGVYTLVNLNN